MILNVRYRLCSITVCEIGWIFDKNSFILRTKLNVLKNFLLRVEREVQFPWKHPFFFVASMLRAEFAKAVQSRIRFKGSQQATCNLRFFHMLLSSLGFDVGLSPCLWCTVFLSIKARRRSLRHWIFTWIKFCDFAFSDFPRKLVQAKLIFLERPRKLIF